MIGTVGLAAFLNDPRIRGIPVILETPKKTESDDKKNIKKVKDMIKR